MKSFMLSLVAIGLGAGIVAAGPSKGSGSNHGSSGISHGPSISSYHQVHGKQFSGGYCYPGRDHNHWSYWGYSQRYGCTCYWCPDTCCYYYWCPTASCYYPVSYIESAPPVEVVAPTPAPLVKPLPRPLDVPVPTPAPVQVQTQTQTQTQTQVVRPVGVPPLP
jgi:hypothetical protein